MKGTAQPIPRLDRGTAPTSAFKSGDMSALLTGGPPLGTDALCRPISARANLQSDARFCHFNLSHYGRHNVIPAGSTVQIRNPIAGNNLSSMITPVAQNLLQYFPNPTGTGVFNNFYAVAGVPIDYNELAIRIDHNITDTARIFGRFTQKWETQTSVGNLYGANDPGGPGQVSPQQPL